MSAIESKREAVARAIWAEYCALAGDEYAWEDLPVLARDNLKRQATAAIATADRHDAGEEGK